MKRHLVLADFTARFGQRLVEIGELVDLANRIAERIVAAMGRAIACDGKMLNATLSVGVAYAEQPASVDWLARLADRALYAAKAAGRNGYRSVIEPTVLPAVSLARR